MKNDTCQNVMDTYFALDKNQRIPLKITLHLLSCKDCRTNIRMMTKAERILVKRHEDYSTYEGLTLFDIMQKIYPEKYSLRKVSMKQWVITGIILVLCMIFATILTAHAIPAIQVFVCIFIGVVLSVYIALFIGTNLDFFVKRVEQADSIKKQ